MINDDNIVERVRKDITSRNLVIQQLYGDSKIKDSIYSFILKNGGSEDDAHDMFTHAIIAFVQQCYSPVFKLKYQIGTYLYSVARHEWINKSKKERKYTEIEKAPVVKDYEPSIETKIINGERFSQLRKGLTRLDEKCKEIMRLWASQLKMREIAIRMNYASENVARKKKHQCLNKLKSIIKDI